MNSVQQGYLRDKMLDIARTYGALHKILNRLHYKGYVLVTIGQEFQDMKFRLACHQNEEYGIDFNLYYGNGFFTLKGHLVQLETNAPCWNAEFISVVVPCDLENSFFEHLNKLEELALDIVNAA